ncbi:MAG: hypothetical protein M3336_00575 [Chloroflexota bacterium]|nr:hypothetical protein [Chloroflexota bacterium]
MSEARHETGRGKDFEERQQSLDPHRAEERDAVTAEVASRLRARGVLLTGEETSEQVVTILEAVERFERAVEARGGDLMVDTRPAREPDNPDFVLPQRAADESIGAYLDRLDEATERVRRVEPDR